MHNIQYGSDKIRNYCHSFEFLECFSKNAPVKIQSLLTEAISRYINIEHNVVINAELVTQKLISGSATGGDDTPPGRAAKVAILISCSHPLTGACMQCYTSYVCAVTMHNLYGLIHLTRSSFSDGFCYIFLYFPTCR